MGNFFRSLLGKDTETRLADIRYQALLDATATYVWSADAAGLLSKQSRTRWKEAFGTDVTHVLDRIESVHPDDQERVIGVWKESLEKKVLWDMEYRLMQDGEYTYYQGRGVPVFDRGPVLLEWIGVSININERKKWEIAIQEAKELAETANKAKSDFLAMMSHELRTPLTAIMGYTEIMAMGVHGPISPEMEQDFGRILRSSDHLLNLINGILDFTKLESGKIRLRNTTVNIGQVVESSYDMIKFQLDEKNHAFNFENTCAATRARADAERVQQTVVNLLSNAIKFTPRGGWIKVKCYSEGKQVVIEVSDTGIGMAPSDLQSIFEPFVQLDSGISRAHGGTGLGLAISRQLVKSMGGDIKVESKVGEGTTFRVYLPIVMKLD